MTSPLLDTPASCLVVSPQLSRALSHAALIEVAGWTAATAAGGLHALTQIERERPPLVVIDPLLDDLSPADLHEILRDDPASAQTIVLIAGAQLPSRYGGPFDVVVPAGSSAPEGLARALARMPGPAAPTWDDPEAASLEGDLSDLGLTDVLLCAQELQLSGLLIVHLGAQPAHLVLRRGEIIDAEYAGRAPTQAATLLLSARPEGDFRFHLLSPDALGGYPKQITLPTARLLMEAAVHVDHAHAADSHSSALEAS
ncbi:DUF4388 domain-containing protein [Deinococcus sp. HMF7620]|uniref:DUF4388 domain-containing protein n=1 Tax=Deinococcus arboris TaxID=2682977 RepID=A0A7C9LR23_9DEIO|nr:MULTISPECIES: DUF4388 domain-containing protein [Deinococcus]MBZ9752465.1 DUF4388 domain-containing protein [Deinococcus betulae]MVN89056.1 DUF4388 domain-containing protein [Deinococcus arboris]